jgi:hypothetical protein
MPRTDTKTTQEQRILNLLHAAWPGEVPAVALSQVSIQLCARIFSIRRSSVIVSNRIVRRSDGTKHSFYRLGAPPIARSSELRKANCKSTASAQQLEEPGSLFGDLMPDRSYAE